MIDSRVDEVLRAEQENEFRAALSTFSESEPELQDWENEGGNYGRD